MADIFDTITVEKPRDIFDTIEPGDIFDEVQVPRVNVQNKVGLLQRITDPIKTFGQAITQSLAAKPAMALRGVTAFTPGEGLGADKVLNKTSEFLESLRNPNTKEEIETKMRGKLFPVQEGANWTDVDASLLPEVINAWAANIGDQIPLMLMTLTGKFLGKLAGKPIGAGAASLVAATTAGPEPTDLITAPTIAAVTQKVVEHLGGAAPLVAVEAGGFLDQAESIGIDRDIAEKYSRAYGVGSGTIEYAQVLWNLKAFSRLTGPARKTLVRRILTELGGNLFEGLEEFSQEGLQNFLIGKAIDEQKARTPGFEARKPSVFEGGGRAFVVGTGVSIFTRGVGRASVAVRGKLQTDAQKEVDQVTEDLVEVNKATEPATIEEPPAEVPVKPAEPKVAVKKPAEVPVTERVPEKIEPEKAKKPKKVAKPLPEKEVTAKIEKEAVAQQAQVESILEGKEGKTEVFKNKRGDILITEETDRGLFNTVVDKQANIKPLGHQPVDTKIWKPITPAAVAEKKPAEPIKPEKAKPVFKVESEAITKAQSIADDTKKSIFITDTPEGFRIVEAKPKIEHVEIKPAAVGLTKAERETLTSQKIAELEILQQEEKRIGFKAGREKAIAEGREKIKSFQLAEKLSTQNRTDALDVVRQFVPKEKQAVFTKRILAAKTAKRVDRITEAVQLFIDRSEKRAAVRDFKAFLSKTNREFRRGEVKLGKLPSDIRERVITIVDKLDPVKLTEAKRKQLEKRDEFIKRVSGTVVNAFESLEEEAIDILQLPNARTTELNRLAKVHTGTLSTEQVNYVRASLEHLIQIVRKRAETRERTRSERIAKQVNTARQEVSQRAKQAGIIEQPKGLAGMFGRVFVQGQSTIRTMVGRATVKDNKATMELLVENIQDAKRAEHVIIKEFSEASEKAIVQDSKFTDKNAAEFNKLVPIKLGGKSFKIDIDNLFSIYMHIKAEGNLRQLLKTRGLNITVVERDPKLLNVIKSKKQIITGRPQLSELREVIKIIEAIPKFKELAETTFDINKDTVSPKVNETSVVLQNYEIARKDKYWPQPRVLVRNIEGKATDISVAIEQQGMFLPKKGGTAPLLIRPYRSQFIDILQTSAQFSASALSARDAKALLGDKKWQDRMRKAGRGAELKGIITMFRRMQGLSTDKAFVDLAGAKLLNNFGKSVLSLRLSGYGIQMASVPAAWEFIEPKHFKVTEKLRKAVRVPEKDIQEMVKLSPTLWVRWKARQFNYVTGGVAAQRSFDNMILSKTPILDKFLNQYTWGDQKAIKMIFDAAQNKVATEQNLKKGTLENKEAAIKETEKAVETQPNWDIVYRSPLTSSPNVFLRGSLMFLAARNAQMNVLMRTVDNFNKDRIGKVEAGKRLIGVLYANTLVAIVKRLLKWGIKASIFGLIFTLGDEEKKEAAVGAIATEGAKEVLRLPQDTIMNIIGLAAFGTIPATIANETIRSFKRPTSAFRKIADIRTGNFFADLSLDVTAIGINAGALGRHLLTREKITRGPRKGRPKWRDDAKDLSLGIAELISIRYGLPLTAPKQELLFQTKAALRAVKPEKKKEFKPGKFKFGQ